MRGCRLQPCRACVTVVSSGAGANLLELQLDKETLKGPLQSWRESLLMQRGGRAAQKRGQEKAKTQHPDGGE